MDMMSFAVVIAAAQIGAGLGLLNGVATAIGQGNVAATAMQAVARQPEAKGSITGTMFLGLAMCETSGIYGLLIAIIMLFANPMVAMFLQYAAK